MILMTHEVNRSIRQINPWEGKNLGAASVREQVDRCLKRLQVAGWGGGWYWTLHCRCQV